MKDKKQKRPPMPRGTPRRTHSDRVSDALRGQLGDRPVEASEIFAGRRLADEQSGPSTEDTADA